MAVSGSHATWSARRRTSSEATEDLGKLYAFTFLADLVRNVPLISIFNVFKSLTVIYFFFRFSFMGDHPILGAFHHIPFSTITSHQYGILLYFMTIYFPYLISFFQSPCGSSYALYRTCKYDCKHGGFLRKRCALYFTRCPHKHLSYY